MGDIRERMSAKRQRGIVRFESMGAEMDRKPLAYWTRIQPWMESSTQYTLSIILYTRQDNPRNVSLCPTNHSCKPSRCNIYPLSYKYPSWHSLNRESHIDPISH